MLEKYKKIDWKVFEPFIIFMSDLNLSYYALKRLIKFWKINFETEEKSLKEIIEKIELL